MWHSHKGEWNSSAEGPFRGKKRYLMWNLSDIHIKEFGITVLKERLKNVRQSAQQNYENGLS